MPTRQRLSRKSRVRPKFDHGEPIRWLGLVPLAGVLAIASALVLTTYGVKPHALIVNLPAPDYYEDTGPLTPTVDRLIILGTSQLLWNGTPITDDELADILDQLTQANPQPGLLFTPDGDAPYSRVIEVLGAIRAKGLIDRCFRFSGIERYRQYERPETFDDLMLARREDCPPPPQRF